MQVEKNANSRKEWVLLWFIVIIHGSSYAQTGGKASGKSNGPQL